MGLLLFMGKIFITAAVGMCSCCYGYQYGSGCGCFSGVLAYLGFGPYVDGGSKLWGGKELNYFLIPVIVSVCEGMVDVHVYIPPPL